MYISYVVESYARQLEYGLISVSQKSRGKITYQVPFIAYGTVKLLLCHF